MTVERQKLFDHWKNIPSFTYITVPEENYFSHPARREIIKILRNGKQELSPDGSSTKRHALNVTEISEELDKRLTKGKLKKTTLYFHLDVLLELGLIETVAILQEGPHRRNKTKYFGRVARNLFLSSTHDTCEKYQLQFTEFQILANLKGLELPKNFQEIPKQLIETQEEYYKVLGKWLTDNEDFIIKNNLEMNLLFDFLKLIYSIHPSYIKLLNNVLNAIQEEISNN